MSNRNIEVFGKFPVLETKRLVLRDSNGPQSVNHAQEIIENWSQSFKEKETIRWGITLKDENRLIGTIICRPIYAEFADHGDYASPPAEIGYELSRKYWNMGIMTEALSGVIPFIFNKVESNRIQAIVNPENLASLKVLKKLGFNVEGYLRDYMYHLGTMKFFDVLMLSILTKDYDANSFRLKIYHRPLNSNRKIPSKPCLRFSGSIHFSSLISGR